jgi:MFS family permease
MTETVRPEPSRLYRWLVLIFLSLAMFGSYYVYDALSPLADVLKQQLGFTDLNIGFLQAIYSFPNIFTVVIGGFIIDRIGLRKSLMIFGVLCFIGPAITVMSSHLSTMATGRLIFGMGAESLNVGSGHCLGTLVQRQGTELCLWLEPDCVSPGYFRRTQLAHLGAGSVCQLASSFSNCAWLCGS